MEGPGPIRDSARSPVLHRADRRHNLVYNQREFRIRLVSFRVLRFLHHLIPPSLFRRRPAHPGRPAGAELRELADQGIYFGTSSWKYEGWLGSIYTPERYTSRGKFSRKKFEAECLAEYARTFPVVCGDFSFYQFPTPAYWRRLFDETPATLRFGFKVPEEITVTTWPGHARYGSRAGQINEAFLDAGHFERGFARPLEPYRARVATLIFEFGTFSKASFSSRRRVHPAARLVPGLTARRVPLRRRDPQSGIPPARLFRDARQP